SGRATSHGRYAKRLLFIQIGGGDLAEESRFYRWQKFPIPSPHLCVGEVELFLRACNPNVEQPSLFLELGRIIEGLRQGKQPVLKAGKEYDRVLESLGVV